MRPARMNLTTVVISPVKPAADVQMDPDFNAPRSNAVETAEVTVRCQIVYSSFQQMRPNRAGDGQGTSGRLTFSRDYLDRIKFMPEKGDRIVKVRDRGDFRVVDLRITSVAPSGHLPDPIIVLAFFQENKERKAAP